MKEIIKVTEYAQKITEALPKGILLNTKVAKFNWKYPLTLECWVLYSQEQEQEKIPWDIRNKMYPQDVDESFCMANRDAHTVYIGEIVAAYIIR